MARRIGLDEHVGRQGQLAHGRLTAVGREVGNDRALPQPDGLPVQRSSRPERSSAAAVDTVGRLDLDHVGAELGERPPAQLGPRRRQIEHA
jgi:hypothetical protein